MNLSTRLTIAMVSLVLLTVAAVGYLSYRNLEATVVPAEISRLEARARMQAAVLDSYVRWAGADVIASTGSTGLHSFMETLTGASHGPTPAAVWRERFAQNLVAHMAAKANYYQFRIIGAANGGREIIRVDRSGPNGAIRIVPQNELQPKGDRSYFKRTITLRRGDVYVSPIELNQEHGIVGNPHVPVVQVGTPIYGLDGKVFGIAIINIDMRPAFAELQRSAREDGQVFLVNENGDYLVHPDRAREFGWELGHPFRIADQKFVQDTITGAWSLHLAGGPQVTIIDALPQSVAMAGASGIARSTLIGALAAALLAGLLAAFTARSMTRPLRSLARAFQNFTGEEDVALPEQAKGEIGILARALGQMFGAVREKTAAIRQYAEREKLYIQAVESASDAIFTVDIGCNITTWNPAAERIFGFTADEAIGKPVSIFASSEQQKEQITNFEGIKLGDGIVNLETVRTKKDGTPIHLSYNSSPIYGPSGDVIGASTIARDITEKRRAEEALKHYAEREKLYVAVVKSANDAIFTSKLDGTLTSWNPAAERLFGFTAEEAIGNNVSIIATPEQRAEQKKYLKLVAQGQRVENLEAHRITKSGAPIEVSFNFSPVLSDSGEVIGGSAIARDITERKQADAMFRVAVESSPGAMVMADAAGKIVLVNAETERMFGYARGELIGMPLEMLIPKKFRDAHAQHRKNFTANPSHRIGAGRDLVGTRKDGSEIAVEVGLNPIKTRDGLLVLAAIVDISERKRHEKAMAERALDLQRSNAELEQFAYVASHDLQEPLRMVASYAELLADRYQGKLDEKADKYISYAVDGAKRMQRLVNDLLTYSRVGAQGHPLQPTDTGTVVGHALRTLKAKIDAAGAEVIVEKLPVVNADEMQLGQVFQNLVGNALKFGRPGEHPRVRVGAQPSPQGWTFFVEDNGIGIDGQYSDRIFQMFQRLHDREAYEGSGIGLTIAKKIVERHGGRIWFESEAGKGTTFFFTIPATEEKAA